MGVLDVAGWGVVGLAVAVLLLNVVAVWPNVAASVVRAVRESRLSGAGMLPRPSERVLTPEQFAARWNRLSPERRATWLAGTASQMDAAHRCWIEDHDVLAGEVERLRDRVRRQDGPDPVTLRWVAETCPHALTLARAWMREQADKIEAGR